MNTISYNITKMKFNKILSMALLFPTLMAISSCEEKIADYTPAEPVTGAQVYFEGAVNTNFVVNSVDTVFTVKLTRVQKDSVATIALKAEADSATLTKFVFPSAATFAAGEATTTITCVAKVDSMEFDTPYTVKLSIANPEDATLYGLSSVTLNVTCPAPWKSLGMGKILDAWMYDAETYFDVEIQQNELEPNIFRVVNPYDQMLEKGGYISGGYYNEGPDKYFEFAIMPAGSTYNGFVLDKEYVVYGDVRTGYYRPDYEAEVYAIHPSRPGKDVETWTYNVVMAYQENGLPGEVSMAPWYYMFGVGGWDKSGSQQISVLFPGYIKADYSAAIEYAGLFTKPDGSMYAIADLTLGADATEVKAIVMPADADAAAVADAIAAGELEAMDVQAGRIEVPFNAEELGGNKFNVIAVVMADGKVKTVVSASYEYYGGGDSNPWTSIGTGFFTDDIVAPLFGAEPVTYEVEILEHSENPGLYRVMNPYSNSVYPYAEDDCAEEGLYLEVNATDTEGAYIQQQSLGFDWGYGEFSFVTNGARYFANYPFETVKAAGYLGAVVEGVIKFPVFERDGGTYQGIVYMGESGYYAGMTNKIEIVLPGANAFARNMAIAKANITKREMAKKSFSGSKADLKLKKLFNLQAEMLDAPNF